MLASGRKLIIQHFVKIIICSSQYSVMLQNEGIFVVYRADCPFDNDTYDDICVLYLFMFHA